MARLGDYQIRWRNAKDDEQKKKNATGTTKHEFSYSSKFKK